VSGVFAVSMLLCTKSTNQYRYKDDEGTFKGEALVLFFRPESVEQAISLVNGMSYGVSGNVLSVERSKRGKKKGEGEKKTQKKVDKRMKRYDQGEMIA
jgi:hypothetical protein